MFFPLLYSYMYNRNFHNHENLCRDIEVNFSMGKYIIDEDYISTESAVFFFSTSKKDAKDIVMQLSEKLKCEVSLYRNSSEETTTIKKFIDSGYDNLKDAFFSNEKNKNYIINLNEESDIDFAIFKDFKDPNIKFLKNIYNCIDIKIKNMSLINSKEIQFLLLFLKNHPIFMEQIFKHIHIRFFLEPSKIFDNIDGRLSVEGLKEILLTEFDQYIKKSSNMHTIFSKEENNDINQFKNVISKIKQEDFNERYYHQKRTSLEYIKPYTYMFIISTKNNMEIINELLNSIYSDNIKTKAFEYYSFYFAKNLTRNRFIAYQLKLIECKHFFKDKMKRIITTCFKEVEIKTYGKKDIKLNVCLKQMDLAVFKCSYYVKNGLEYDFLVITIPERCIYNKNGTIELVSREIKNYFATNNPPYQIFDFDAQMCASDVVSLYSKEYTEIIMKRICFFNFNFYRRNAIYRDFIEKLIKYLNIKNLVLETIYFGNKSHLYEKQSIKDMKISMIDFKKYDHLYYAPNFHLKDIDKKHFEVCSTVGLFLQILNIKEDVRNNYILNLHVIETFNLKKKKNNEFACRNRILNFLLQKLWNYIILQSEMENLVSMARISVDFYKFLDINISSGSCWNEGSFIKIHQILDVENITKYKIVEIAAILFRCCIQKTIKQFQRKHKTSNLIYDRDFKPREDEFLSMIAEDNYLNVINQGEIFLHVNIENNINVDSIDNLICEFVENYKQ